MTDRTTAERRRTARVLARADAATLAHLWETWAQAVPVEALREPEAGLVMVQGRIAGSGDRFNLGEATVTRASVVAHVDGEQAVGTAYVLGSHPDHAELAARFDALLGSALREHVLAEVVDPLADAQQADDETIDAAARATTVDFLTVSREHGDDDEEDDE